MVKAIGLMSGTSLDGVDVALVNISGSYTTTKVEVIDFQTYDIPPSLKEKIKSQIHPDKTDTKLLTSINFEIAEVFADSVMKIIKKNELKSEDIEFIASHGQTIYHIPDKSENLSPSTLQLGDGSVIANLTNIKTIFNFRTADMAVGGQGAPLVPYVDYVLFNSKEKTRIMLNIGGISNITYLKQNGSIDDVIAFDTGPGNMIINYFMEKLYQKPYDDQGKVARTGDIVKELFAELLDDEYISLKPPKSTGREKYGNHFAEKLLNKYNDYKNEDLIRTVTEFTAITIAKNIKALNIEGYIEVLASGGGAYNLFLLERLQSYLENSKVLTTNDFGMDIDQKEAIAFAILGNETNLGNFSNVKSATGAKKDVILGQIANVLQKSVSKGIKKNIKH